MHVCGGETVEKKHVNWKQDFLQPAVRIPTHQLWDAPELGFSSGIVTAPVRLYFKEQNQSREFGGGIFASRHEAMFDRKTNPYELSS